MYKKKTKGEEKEKEEPDLGAFEQETTDSEDELSLETQDLTQSTVLDGKVIIDSKAYQKEGNLDYRKSYSQIAAFLHLKNKDTKKSYEKNLVLVENMLNTLDGEGTLELAFRKYFDTGCFKKTKYASWLERKSNSKYPNNITHYARNDIIVSLSLKKLEKSDCILYSLLTRSPTEWIFFLKLKLYALLKKRVRLIFTDCLEKVEELKNVGYGTFNNVYRITGTLKRLNSIESCEVIANTWKCHYCPTETFVTKQWFEKEKSVICSGCGQGRTSNPYLYEKPNHKLLESWLSGTLHLDLDESSTKLDHETKSIVLRFFNTDLSNDIKIGDKLQLMGILKKTNTGVAKDDYIYLDVLAHQKFKDDCEEIKNLSPARIDELKLLSKNPNLWTFLCNTVYPDIYGLDACKKTAILQQCSLTNTKKSTTEETEYEFLERDTIHLLLVGDAGCGKSRIMNRTYQVFGGLKTCGYSSTSAGLTAGVYKDASGNWGVDAGLLVLGNKKVVYLDELDKIPKNDIIHSLLECMEQQTVSLSKVNTHGTYEAKTGLFAAANPRYKSNFDDVQSLIAQIELPNMLLSRFDLVLPVIQDINYKSNVKMKIKVPKEDLKLVKDYLNYAKTIEIQAISDQVISKVEDLVGNINDRIKKVKTLKKQHKSLNPRIFPSLLRLICSKSRSRLSNTPDLNDFRFVRDLYIDVMVKLYGIERPLYNSSDQLVDESGLLVDTNALINLENRQDRNIVYDISNTKASEVVRRIKEALTFSPMDLTDLVAYVSEKDPTLTVALLNTTIKKLENHGVIYKPDMKKYKLATS